MKIALFSLFMFSFFYITTFPFPSTDAWGHVSVQAQTCLLHNFFVFIDIKKKKKKKNALKKKQTKKNKKTSLSLSSLK